MLFLLFCLLFSFLRLIVHRLFPFVDAAQDERHSQHKQEEHHFIRPVCAPEGARMGFLGLHAVFRVYMGFLGFFV
jgi:hypothetical protein